MVQLNNAEQFVKLVQQLMDRFWDNLQRCQQLPTSTSLLPDANSTNNQALYSAVIKLLQYESVATMQQMFLLLCQVVQHIDCIMLYESVLFDILDAMVEVTNAEHPMLGNKFLYHFFNNLDADTQTDEYTFFFQYLVSRVMEAQWDRLGQTKWFDLVAAVLKMAGCHRAVCSCLDDNLWTNSDFVAHLLQEDYEYWSEGIPTNVLNDYYNEEEEEEEEEGEMEEEEGDDC